MKSIIFTLIILSIEISQCTGQCWKEIKCGYSHVLAIKSDGSLWAWGYNYFGQLGNKDTNYTNSSYPLVVGIDTNWKAIDCGDFFSAGIKSDGTLWTWGYNNHWALGNGIAMDVNYPKQINSDTNWSKISAGSAHCLAIKSNGTLWAWGHNAYAQLGIGGTFNSPIPVQVGLETNWKSASAGFNHSLAKNNAETNYGFGSNATYQLLNTTPSSPSDSPRVLLLDTSWKSLNAGIYFTIGLKKNGSLYGWGFNLFGQLGNGTTIDSPIPSLIGQDSIWKDIATGTNHCVALKKDGTLWSWGANNSGQLGIGTNTNSLWPVQIGTDTNWSNVYSSGFYSMALKSDGTLWSWGDNQRGQLGDGTIISKQHPVKVTCELVQPASLSIEKTNYNIYVYPNPTSNFVEIFGASSIETNKIQLYNILGKIVKLYPKDSKLIDLRELISGNYLLVISFMDGRNKTVKLTKL